MLGFHYRDDRSFESSIGAALAGQEEKSKILKKKKELKKLRKRNRGRDNDGVKMEASL